MQVTKIEDALSSITGRDTHGNRSVRLTRIPTASRSIGVGRSEAMNVIHTAKSA